MDPLDKKRPIASASGFQPVNFNDAGSSDALTSADVRASRQSPGTVNRRPKDHRPTGAIIVIIVIIVILLGAYFADLFGLVSLPFPQASEDKNTNRSAVIDNNRRPVPLNANSSNVNSQIRNTNLSNISTNRPINGNQNTTQSNTNAEVSAAVLARDVQVKSDLDQYRTALELYIKDNPDGYPANKVNGTADALASTIYEKYLTEYLDKAPTSPSTEEYMYMASDDASGYKIYSRLEATGSYYWTDQVGGIGESAGVPPQSISCKLSGRNSDQ